MGYLQQDSCNDSNTDFAILRFHAGPPYEVSLYDHFTVSQSYTYAHTHTYVRTSRVYIFSLYYPLFLTLFVHLFLSLVCFGYPLLSLVYSYFISVSFLFASSIPCILLSIPCLLCLLFVCFVYPLLSLVYSFFVSVSFLFVLSIPSLLMFLITFLCVSFSLMYMCVCVCVFVGYCIQDCEQGMGVLVEEGLQEPVQQQHFPVVVQIQERPISEMTPNTNTCVHSTNTYMYTYYISVFVSNFPVFRNVNKFRCECKFLQLSIMFCFFFVMTYIITVNRICQY